MDIQMPVQAIPFQERFNDHTAGVALQGNIIVFEDINACDYYEDLTLTDYIMTENEDPIITQNNQNLEIE
jgi:hypothetical protein